MPKRIITPKHRTDNFEGYMTRPWREKWLPLTFLMTLLMATCLVCSSAPVLAQSSLEKSCQLERSLKIIYQLMSDHKSSELIAQQIEGAMKCPDADLDYDLALYQSLHLISLGDVTRARDAAERAVNNGASDRQREVARHLMTLLGQSGEETQQYYLVTFVMADGTEAAVDIGLGPVASDAYAPDTRLEEILGSELAFLATGLNTQMIQTARKQMKISDKIPLRVWLPRGTYTLTTGQTLRAEGPVQSITFPVNDIRWPRHTSTLGVGGMALVPMNAERTGLQFSAGAGLSLQHLIRLEGPNLLLSLDGGFYPLGISNQGCQQPSGEGTLSCDDFQAEGSPSTAGAFQLAAYGLGVGVSRPVMLSRNLPLLLGVKAEGLGAVNSVWTSGPCESSEGETGLNCPFLSSAFVPSLHAEAQLLYWLKLKQARGALSASLSGGLGELLYVPLGEQSADASFSQRFQTLNAQPGQQLTGSLAIRLGGSVVF